MTEQYDPTTVPVETTPHFADGVTPRMVFHSWMHRLHRAPMIKRNHHRVLRVSEAEYLALCDLLSREPDTDPALCTPVHQPPQSNAQARPRRRRKQAAAAAAAAE